MSIFKSKSKKADADNQSAPKSISVAYGIQSKNKKRSPGPTPMPHAAADSADDDMAQTIAEAIMKRRKMADGGMVDLKENAEEGLNEADELNLDAAGKENYSEESGLDDLDYGNESIGDDIDSDKHDMISKIRAKMKSKKPE